MSLCFFYASIDTFNGNCSQQQHCHLHGTSKWWEEQAAPSRYWSPDTRRQLTCQKFITRKTIYNVQHGMCENVWPCCASPATQCFSSLLVISSTSPHLCRNFGCQFGRFFTLFFRLLCLFGELCLFSCRFACAQCPTLLLFIYLRVLFGILAIVLVICNHWRAQLPSHATKGL